MDRLRLAPSAHIFLRGGTAVQFGLDATRAGVVETEHAPALVAALMTARSPVTDEELTARITVAGMTGPAAHSLVADLTAYRILVPASAGSVILLGRSRLAAATGDLLRAAGVKVRTPLLGESEYAYLAGTAVDSPVLVVDRLAHSRTMAPLLARLARTWAPATIVDGRGMIGPLRVNGRGPCPLCGDLHRAARDNRWYPTVSQLPTGPTDPDPVTVAATAARLVAVAQHLLGLHLEPPGAPVQQLRPGAVIEVNPRGTGGAPQTMPPHPGCPVCFYY